MTQPEQTPQTVEAATEGMPDEGPQDEQAIALVNSSRPEDLRGADQ